MSVFGLRTLIQNFLFFQLMIAPEPFFLFIVGQISQWLLVVYVFYIEPGFSSFFTTSPKFFCQEGDVPTIKILLKNTKSMQVYCDFFHGICSSQYEQWIGINKLNNVTFQSQKIKGFWENQSDIYDRWIELASPKNHFMSPLWGRVPKVEKLGYRKTVPLLE